MNNVFQTEEELFRTVQKSNLLHQLHCSADWLTSADTEVEGLFGRPDYLISYYKMDSRGRRQFRSVAFEMKLADWKRALIQAYRYAAFAHYVYVLMDYTYVNRALRSIDCFFRSNIGLLSFSNKRRLRIHYRPRCRTPYSPTLRVKLYKKIWADVKETSIQEASRERC
jgi:hypothetical protein